MLIKQLLNLFKLWCEWGIIQVWSSLPSKLHQILFLSIRKFVFDQKLDLDIFSFIVLAPIQQANDLFDVISQCNTVGPLFSGHPRDFENWPLNRGWPFNRGASNTAV